MQDYTMSENYKNYHESSHLDRHSLIGFPLKRKVFERFKRNKLRYLFRFFGVPDIFSHAKKVLDIGCGSGYTLSVFSVLKESNPSNPSAEFFGIDFVKTKDLPDWVTFFSVDLGNDKFPFPENTFDFVICGCAIEHVGNPINIFNEAYSVLKREGTFHVLTENVSSILLPSLSNVSKSAINFYDYAHKTLHEKIVTAYVYSFSFRV